MSQSTAATPGGDVDSRYGRARTRQRDRWVLGSLAAAIVLVFAAWVLWATFGGQGASLDVDDTAHSVVDEHTVDVTFELSVTTGSTVYCAVQALNEQFAIVGWKVVEVPPSEAYTRSLTERVRTTQPATTGLINHCWLA